MNSVEDLLNGSSLGVPGGPPGDFAKPHRRLVARRRRDGLGDPSWFGLFCPVGPQDGEDLLLNLPDTAEDDEAADDIFQLPDVSRP